MEETALQERIDHDVTKAVLILKKGDTAFLEAGIILAEMDTKYGTGAVDKVAHEAKREPKTIYRYRNAGRMYLEVKEICSQGQNPPDAPYGMYEAAWKMEQKYEVGPVYWLAQIDTAVAENIKIKPFVKLCTQELRETIAGLKEKIEAAREVLGGIMDTAYWEDIPKYPQIDIVKAYKILAQEAGS